MSTKQIEALKLALEALRVARESVSEWSSYASDYFKDKYDLDGDFEAIDASIEVIEAVLAEQGCDYCNHPQYAGIKCKNCGREQPAQQEPFGYFRYDMRLDAWVQNREGLPGTAFYTSPSASKQWQGLTDEEIEQVCVPLGAAMLSFTEVARAIEAKLREKNA